MVQRSKADDLYSVPKALHNKLLRIIKGTAKLVKGFFLLIKFGHFNLNTNEMPIPIPVK